MPAREDVSFEATDDYGLLYAVQRVSGKLTAEICVCGHVVIDDVPYSYDRHIRVRLTRDKD